jgi:hypothetical protein
MDAGSEQDAYFTAEGEQDGRPILFRGLQAIPAGIATSELPHLVSITWAYEHDGVGMPDPDLHQLHNDFEDLLDPLDHNAIGRLVLVVTGNGRKEWHWYVRDVGAWLASVNEVLAGTPVLPIELTTRLQPDWRLFREFLAAVDSN